MQLVTFAQTSIFKQMFLESPMHHSRRSGWIEVITGCMFSGKTEELIRRLKRAQIAKQRVEIFKPEVDKRYDERDIISHDNNAIPSTPIPSADHILLLANEVEVVGIDEAQFFDDRIVEVCNTLANRGVRVVIAGLDLDYMGRPFGPMPQLMAIAEYVTKVHAICVETGQPAHYSFRREKDESLIMLGEKNEYEPLSRASFYAKMKENEQK